MGPLSLVSVVDPGMASADMRRWWWAEICSAARRRGLVADVFFQSERALSAVSALFFWSPVHMYICTHLSFLFIVILRRSARSVRQPCGGIPCYCGDVSMILRACLPPFPFPRAASPRKSRDPQGKTRTNTTRANSKRGNLLLFGSAEKLSGLPNAKNHWLCMGLCCCCALQRYHLCETDGSHCFSKLKVESAEAGRICFHNDVLDLKTSATVQCIHRDKGRQCSAGSGCGCSDRRVSSS
jgi:hypothetical protein